MNTTLSKKTKQVYNQAIARLKSSNFSEAERIFQKCMEAYGNKDESRMIRITWMKMKQKFYNKCA